MEKHLKDLSAWSLRHLLIQEVRKFIKCLDHGSVDELQQIKFKLKEIFDLLIEKESHEIVTISSP